MLKSGRIYMFILFLTGINVSVTAQPTICESPKSLISLEYQYLYAKIDNPIRIVAQQEAPVSIDQLSASFLRYDAERREAIDIIERNGFYMIHPDTVGMVELKITIGETVETKTLNVKSIEAVGRVGRFRANSREKIKIGEFKAQKGIAANVECCGFDASCRVLGFETIRISSKNAAERAMNPGGKFTERSQELILRAEKGDLFVFRQIRYQCPGAAQPQRLEDMIFEIE
jgi:hypothetical protein